MRNCSLANKVSVHKSYGQRRIFRNRDGRAVVAVLEEAHSVILLDCNMGVEALDSDQGNAIAEADIGVVDWNPIKIVFRRLLDPCIGRLGETVEQNYEPIEFRSGDEFRSSDLRGLRH